MRLYNAVPWDSRNRWQNDKPVMIWFLALGGNRTPIGRFKVCSDNHYTTRAKKSTPHAGLEPAILRLEVARVIQLRQWGTHLTFCVTPLPASHCDYPSSHYLDLCSLHFHLQIPTHICTITLHYNCKASHHMFSFRFSPESPDSGQPPSHTGNWTPSSALKGPYVNHYTMWEIDMLTNRHFRSWAPLLAQNCETLTSSI